MAPYIKYGITITHMTQQSLFRLPYTERIWIVISTFGLTCSGWLFRKWPEVGYDTLIK